MGKGVNLPHLILKRGEFLYPFATYTVPFKSKLTLDSRSSHESRIGTQFSMTTSRFSMSASRFSMFASRFSYSIPARLAKLERVFV